MRLSILDYSPVDEGGTAAEALADTRKLARADALGYERFWVSEHHHTDALAGVAPEMLMMHLADSTRRIKVGSGGVMLPHYSSIKVAENYKMIEALHPGRVDLGFGRAPGADALISHALNEEKARDLPYDVKVSDLKSFVTGHYPVGHRFARAAARPKISTSPQMWVLGASGSTAGLAAKEGLGFTFAHFINPGGRGVPAAQAYREQFVPSELQPEPEVIVTIFVAVAESRSKADDLATAFHLWLAQIESPAALTALPSVSTARHHRYTAGEAATIERNRNRLVFGTPSEVRSQIEQLAEAYSTDQIMINPNVPGLDARMTTIELVAKEFGLN